MNSCALPEDLKKVNDLLLVRQRLDIKTITVGSTEHTMKPGENAKQNAPQSTESG
jgi:hypothetical protein